MSKIDEQIQRLKDKLQEYKGPEGIRPCLSEQEVAAFETEYDVRLPEEYRRFLLEVGNGETFMPQGPNWADYNSTWIAYGIKGQSAPSWLDFCELWENLSEPFLQTEPWHECQELTETQRTPITHYTHGKLLLLDEGCGSRFYLIITGPERGNVWSLWDQGSAPIEPRTDFLSWYERLIDERLESQNKHGVRSLYASGDYDIVFPDGVEEF